MFRPYMAIIRFFFPLRFRYTNCEVEISHPIIILVCLCIGGYYITLIYIYRVSQEERTKLRKSVPYVKLYRYNPKHLYPKLNGYGGNGQRKVWTSCISAYCTSTAV